MNEPRDLRVRARELFPAPEGALPEMHRRWGRRQRNRRIRAGALGIIVALVTGLVLARSLISDGVPADLPVEPAPAVSGALVYASDGDIYVADPDGTNAVAITDVGTLDDGCPGEVGYGLPSWSPDGRYLAFRGPQDAGCAGSTGVVIADPQGSVVATIPVGDQPNVMPPEWSPDSTRVAVWDEYKSTIGVYRIDGTRETQIAFPPGLKGDLGELAWMPDGASLTVDQYEVPLDGGTPRELFPFNWQPQRFSPDGSRVAYAANRHVLMVARPDGSEARAVFRGHQPYTWTWSPNGELIALTADPPGDPWAVNQVHVVDEATGSSTLLLEGERRTVFRVTGFSPEGDHVLFMRWDGEDDPGSLWSVGVDGTDAHQVVAGSTDGAWRPA
jgi:Tol biopolymer transport system component